MVVYAIHYPGEEEKIHFIGFLPEKRKHPERQNSGSSLRSKSDIRYIANFQTNKKGLVDGDYTAVVHDGCTEEVLGYIEFELSSRKNTNRGNKPSK